MPQKKPAKKAKAEKSKKPAKPVKAPGLGAALKKAAKNVAKTVGLAAAKKAAPGKKPAPAAVPPKKAEAGKKGAAPAAPAKGKAPFLTLVKGKAAPAAKPTKEELKKGAKGAPAKPEGKKGKEVVVVVPAPKGVALLAKDAKGKKAGKLAAENAARAKRCREPGCDHDFTLQGYCRLHYIKNWRRLKRKEAILASGQLNNYVEELVNKYPDKYLDVIRQDLASEKEWGKVVVDLELENSEEEGGAEEDIDTVAEGVRPAGGGGGGRGEFDDEGDAF